jgi:hypothetical protein
MKIRWKTAALGLGLSLAWMMTAQAAFKDVAPKDLGQFLRTHAKTVVLFDSGDPKCGPCEPDDGGPFAVLSEQFQPSQVQFIRVRWSPWSAFPEELPRYDGSKEGFYFAGIPSVAGYEGERMRFLNTGKMKDETLARKLIADKLGVKPSR